MSHAYTRPPTIDEGNAYKSTNQSVEIDKCHSLVHGARLSWETANGNFAESLVLPPVQVEATDSATLAHGLLGSLEKWVLNCKLLLWLQWISAAWSCFLFCFVADQASANIKLISYMMALLINALALALQSWQAVSSCRP